MKQKILITGAAGFVGARFVESCASRGITPVSVDQISHFAQRPEHRAISFGEKLSPSEVLPWLGKNHQELRAVVHLGAITDTTCLDEALLRKMNIEASQGLWNSCTQFGIPLIYASSAATYGDGAMGYDDDESLIPKLNPLNPYGESKRQFDLWALEQEKQKKTPPQWCGFKFFNVFGFGERHKGKMASVVLHAFDQISKSGSVKLFKSYRKEIPHGEQKRDFIYVDDVISALWFALEKPIPRGIFNLGTGHAHSFLDLVRPIFPALGKKEAIEFIEMPPGLPERYQYFTEARMDRLYKEGYRTPFTKLEVAVAAYTHQLSTTSV